MSSEQITYVLVALVVTSVAILLLLAGALVARRGRGDRSNDLPSSVPLPAVAPAPAPAPAQPAPALAVSPSLVAPHVDAAPVPAATAMASPAATPVASSPQANPGDAATPHPDTERALEEPSVTAAELEAAARRVHDPREQDVIEGFLSISPRRRDAAAFEAPRAPTVAAPVVADAKEDVGSGAIPADMYLDDVTGLDSRAAWDRTLADENARYVRYRRPIGVVVAEVDGLARFEREFGGDASRRILAAVGGAMRRDARRTDRVAHVGGGRFLVLLPETDEIQAINYVERVRRECELWLEAGAVALHVAMGWASPSAVGELDTALRTAEERMYAERRRAARAGTAEPDAPR